MNDLHIAGYANLSQSNALLAGILHRYTNRQAPSEMIYPNGQIKLEEELQNRAPKNRKPQRKFAHLFTFLERGFENLGFTFHLSTKSTTETGKSTSVFRSGEELMSAE